LGAAAGATIARSAEIASSLVHIEDERSVSADTASARPQRNSRHNDA